MNGQTAFSPLGPIVPVVVLTDSEQAVPLAQALLKGGMLSVEITMRTPEALSGIRKICEQVPQLLVGAGTVLDVQMAQDAAAAGAKFIVSPGFDPQIVTWCQEHCLPVYPGVTTPSEIMQAMKSGLHNVKFFPAELSGGIPMLKSLASPFSSMRFMPTGGIGPNNVRDYLQLPNVMACGGSWLCPKKLIESNDFAQITTLCQEAINMLP